MGFGLLACQVQPELVPTHEREPAPASTPESTPTIAPTPEPTPAPTPEPVPTTVPVPTDLADRSPLLLVHAGMLILDTKAERGWARGRISEPPGDVDNYRASKPLVPEAIPVRHLAQRARSFDVYDREGVPCRATLGELRVIAQYGGPDVDDLYDQLDYANGTPQVQPRKAEIIAKVWDTQPHWLVAELIPEPDCQLDDALWARDAQLPAPVLLSHSREENAVTRERARLFEASRELADKRSGHQAWYDALEPEQRGNQLDWDATVERYPLEITSWLDPGGQPQLIELRFGAAPGCGEDDFFDTTLEAFEQVGGGGFVPTGVEGGPVAVFDADLDGRFEYLHATGAGSHVVHSSTLASEAQINADLHCAC